MKKKMTSVVLALCMLGSCASVGSVTASAAGTTDNAVSAAADYGLPENIRDGNILHCFNWKYSDIQAALPSIAAAGFTSVQTSPAQQPDSTGPWYWLYQPLGFSVASGPLGNSSQLQQLCTAAHQYGINVIVDVVANHLSSDHNRIQNDLKASQYWHNDMTITDYDNRNLVINGKVGMPDLNTSNSYVQQVVRNYVQSLKNLGIDGIRWDAAKHIGLPSEGDNFWTNVLDSDLFNYGEIMDKPGGDHNKIIKQYADLMNVTDHGYSGEIMGHVRDNGVYSPSGHWATEAGVDADKLVLFAETHDSFSNDVKDGGWTKNLSQNYVDRAYALVAARAGSQALYFSRPSSTNKENIYSGTKGSTHFTSAEVAAVNQFHNAMVGTQEAYTTGGGCSVVCREGGAVVVSPQGANVQVTVPNANGLVPVGTYTDKVSNTSWTVTATEMTGTIGSKGIAVFYTDPVAKPSVSVNPGSKSYTTDTLTVSLSLNNATSGSYSVDGGSYTSFTSNTNVTIGSGKDYGTVTTLSVKATNGTETSDPVTYTYTKEDPNAGQTIFFDNSSYHWSTVYCYLYTEGGGEATPWPGTAMTAGSNNLYTLKVPAGFETSKVIFTESENATTNRYPAELEPGMDMAGASMIFGANHSWTEYSSQPTQPSQATQPTQATQATTPTPDGQVLIGDVDGNGSISIKDATYIQAYIAEMMDLTGNALIAADVNKDGYITIKDVTALQRYLADLAGADCYAGQTIRGGGDETQPSTEVNPEPEKKILFTNNKGWSKVYAYACDADNKELLGSWPGTEMQSIGNNDLGEPQYSILVPGDTHIIVFSDGSSQTIDIPFDKTVTGYYPLDTQDEFGHYNVGSWTNNIDNTDATGGGDNPPIPPEGTVLFTNNRGWGNILAYAWNDNGETLLGEWPGTAMESIGNNDLGEPQFSISVPAGTAYIIFTDGISQTVDIPYDRNVTGYYPTGAVDGNGNYEVGSWTEGQGGGEIIPGGTVLFTNNRGWGNISAYAWSADNTELLGAWPGTAMQSVGNNDLGEPQFSITVPEGTAYIIFTDGISQTVDIPYDSSVTGYYPTGNIDGDGNYEVDSWTDGQGGGEIIPGGTVLFTNNKGWGNISAYAWSADNTELLGAWPGTAMQSVGNNDLGEPQFSITVPDGTAYIIFTDGISQTVDIPYNSSVTGYYPTGSVDGNGNYEVDSWTDGQGGGGEDLPGGTVLFTNNKGWGNILAYAWNENGAALLGEWPGTAMQSVGNNDLGEPQFSISVPAGTAYIIFTDGISQTVDIPYDSSVTGYYPTGDLDGNNNYEVGSWTDGQTGGGGGGGEDLPDGTKTVLFTNNFNWGEVFCYAWDDAENKCLGEWPGTRMSDAGDNGYGSHNFSAEVPLSATHLIFSGNGQQTVDITFDQSVTGWYLTGNYIDGKLEVATW